MPDQATELRKLTLDHGRSVSRPSDGASRLLVVSGGKGGIGSTTIAINLAVALAADHQQVLLVEVDDSRNDITTLCGLVDDESCLDGRSRPRDLDRQMQNGPGGIHVLPAIWNSPGRLHPESTSPSHHLFHQLRQLQHHHDIMIVDVGNRTHGLASRLWESADDLLLVTTCDPIAIMNSYTILKTQSLKTTAPRVHSVVNYASSKTLAANVHRRIDHACRRFLGFPVLHLGALPEDPRFKEAAVKATPLLKHVPETPTAQLFTAMARQLLLKSSTMAQLAMTH